MLNIFVSFNYPLVNLNNKKVVARAFITIHKPVTFLQILHVEHCFASFNLTETFENSSFNQLLLNWIGKL